MYKEYILPQKNCISDDYLYYQSKDNGASTAVAYRIGTDGPIDSRLEIYDGTATWTLSDGNKVTIPIYELGELLDMVKVIQKHQHIFDTDNDAYEIVR